MCMYYVWGDVDERFLKVPHFRMMEDLLFCFAITCLIADSLMQINYRQLF